LCITKSTDDAWWSCIAFALPIISLLLAASQCFLCAVSLRHRPSNMTWAASNMSAIMGCKIQAHLSSKPTACLFPSSSARLVRRRRRDSSGSLQMLRGFSVLCSRAVVLPLSPPPRFLRRLPHPRSFSSSSSSPLPPPLPSPGMEATYKFGPYKIDAREVFHATPLSYAMVNLRPLLPGHILLFQ
ncbi:unnamed protein product, partial [Urochloa humidicola]